VEMKVWGETGGQTPDLQRRPSQSSSDYGGSLGYDATASAARTAQRPTMPSHLFATPYNPRPGNFGGSGERSDLGYTPASSARGPYGDATGGVLTPVVYRQTPTAAGYTPFNHHLPDRVVGEEQPPFRSLYDDLEIEGVEGTPKTLQHVAMRSPGDETADVENGTWVTVFGFPPSQASHVLKLFQEIGDIVRHNIPVGQCNWMHIQFQTSIQARQALSRNGKNFGGNLMVGVIECTNPTVQTAGSSTAEFPRPINPPPQPWTTSHRVDIYGSKAPRRSDTLWAKFVEYVIGA